jgi:hypothetical protein
MIFGRLLFSYQVARRLFAMGWRREDMPSKPMFRDLCAGLRESGYDIDAAANLWDKCLHFDREAIEQLKRDTGFYGILHLTQFFGPAQDLTDPDSQEKKPRRAAKTKKRK